MERRKERRKERSNPPKRVYQHHPLYGPIPMVPHRTTWRGRETLHYHYDLDYKPELPPRAVRADPHKQNLCFHCNAPMYFYVDQPRTCTQCGADFVFSGREQKFWYEQLGFYGTSVAIRCVACRKQRRTVHSLSQQIGAAKEATRVDAKDPTAWLALAEATVRYHQRTCHGDLDEAIAAARRVHKLAPDSVEPLFWEGMAHGQAGRAEKAKPLLRQFATAPANSRRSRELRAEASRRLLKEAE